MHAIKAQHKKSSAYNLVISFLSIIEKKQWGILKSVNSMSTMLLGNIDKLLHEKSGKAESLLRTIQELIENSRSEQNQLINRLLNQLLYELGSEMTQRYSSWPQLKRELAPVIKSFRKRFGEPFTLSHFHNLYTFALQFNNPHLSSWISSMISWPHIEILLSVESMEAKVFYAQLAAGEELGPAVLKQHITARLFEQTPGARESAQELLHTIQHPHIEHTTKKNIHLATVYLPSGPESSIMKQDIYNEHLFKCLLPILHPIKETGQA